MLKLVNGLGAVALLWSPAAWAEDMSVAGHRVSVTADGMGATALVVDDTVLHESEVIYLDPAPLQVDGQTVLTGVAGSGGNACQPAPFVLSLPPGAEPALFGPIDTCFPVEQRIEGDRLVFTSTPLPSQPGGTWIWTPDGGLQSGPYIAFTGTSGWEAFDRLAQAHPVEAMSIAPVLEALQTGLGADYPAFAERISELGSGDLTAEGYRGGACLKYSCETDWAVLYLHRASEGVYAIWHKEGETEPHLWPEDTTLWPPEAVVALREAVGE
jgi:hypothetical protein